MSPADLTDLHVIHYELERDLMPLILSNTQYSIEKGQETLHEYDLFKIQQQIISRFLLGKPRITLDVSNYSNFLKFNKTFFNLHMNVFLLQGIPTLVNRHDRDYKIILRDVKTKVKQVSYSYSLLLIALILIRLNKIQSNQTIYISKQASEVYFKH